MANPTSVGTDKGDYKPGLVVTDNAEVAVTLDPLKPYSLVHTGLDGTGAGTADTTPVYLSFNGTVATATSAGNPNKAILTSLRTMEIGPGLSEVSFLTSDAANEPAIVIIPRVTTRGQQ